MDYFDLYFASLLAGHNTQYVTELNSTRGRYWRRETPGGEAVTIPEPSTLGSIEG